MSAAPAFQAFFACFQIAGLALFLILTVSRTLHLKARLHINPIVLSLHKRGLLGTMEAALFVGVNLWVVLVLLHVLPLPIQRPEWLFGTTLIDSFLAKIVGVLLVLAAFLLRTLAMAALGDSWRLGLDEKVPGPLVTTGVYAVTRNPIYLFFNLWFIGTFLLNGTSVFLALALLAFANLHYQILQEEHFLAEVHGTKYERYCRRTPRYFALRRAPRRRVVL